MTRKEALTRVLEEGIKVFEHGGAFTVNGVLFANYFEKAKLKTDYNENTGVIDALYMTYEGNTLACVCIDAIKYISVSVSTVFVTNENNYCHGRINGKQFRVEGVKGGE